MQKCHTFDLPLVEAFGERRLERPQQLGRRDHFFSEEVAHGQRRSCVPKLERLKLAVVDAHHRVLHLSLDMEVMGEGKRPLYCGLILKRLVSRNDRFRLFESLGFLDRGSVSCIIEKPI